MPDLNDPTVSEYNRQVKMLLWLCIGVVVGSIFLGFISFLCLGIVSADALQDSIIAFTLGGGALAVSGFARAVTIMLSFAGVVFISLIVSIITLSVQKNSMTKMAAMLFKKEYQAAGKKSE